MRAAFIAAGILLSAWADVARADDLDPDRDSLSRTTPEELRNGDDSQLRFLAYFITRAEVTNVAPTNDLLQGRIVGRLFGRNTTTTSQGTSWLIEQRLIPFIVFEPKILDKMARLRASFELNWTWGDSSYSTGGNFGGALSGRRSTSRRRTSRSRSICRAGWHVNIGLQRLWDNIRASVSHLLHDLKRSPASGSRSGAPTPSASRRHGALPAPALQLRRVRPLSQPGRQRTTTSCSSRR